MNRVWSKLVSLSTDMKNWDVFSKPPNDFLEHNFALLPDGIVEDIFARLPAESVLACKRVCWRWYDIITVKDFAMLHRKRVDEVVNLAMFKTSTDYIQLKRHVYTMKIHTTGGLNLERIDILEPQLDSTIEELKLVTSCHGLVLLKCGSLLNTETSYLICNPTTKEIATFVPPREFVYRTWDDEVTRQKKIFYGDIVGFFYDEIRSEYKILQYCLEDLFVTYYVYGLRSKSEKNLGTYKLNPSRDFWATSVFVGRKLCWIVYYVGDVRLQPSCSQCIMTFDSESETLHCLPHPGSECDPVLKFPHAHFQLLVLDSNNLGVSVSSLSTITIWVLEGSVNFTWGIRYVINYEVGLRHYPVINESVSRRAEVINLVGGELVFRLYSKGFFTLNLRSGAMRKLKLPREILRQYEHENFKGILHVKSLISPKQIFG